MKRTDTWIVVGILVSGAVALFAKSAGAAPSAVPLVQGHTYRYTWTFSRALTAAEQAQVRAMSPGAVVSAQQLSYSQIEAMPGTLMVTPGQTTMPMPQSLGSPALAVTLKLVSVTEVGA